MKTEKELDIIRGKMLVGKVSTEELLDFLEYVSAIEALVEEASNEDFYGTEGWKRRIDME